MLRSAAETAVVVIESPYVGGRTLKWLKVKVPHYREVERGWEPPKS
jgi:hypothetical protein